MAPIHNSSIVDSSADNLNEIQNVPTEKRTDIGNQRPPSIFCLPNKKKICGPEAVCVQLRGSQTYHCICPQDSSVPTPDFKCKLKKAVQTDQTIRFQVSVERSTLPVGITPVATNASQVTLTTMETNNHSPTTQPIKMSETNTAILSASALVFVILLMILTWRILRYKSLKKRNRNHETKAFAISLRKNILTEERYTTNPHYTSAGSPTDIGIPMVPIISRSAVTDLQKIGEGFFGEVFKGQLHVIDDNGVERVETVAVKTLKHATNLEAEEDLMREVEIMSSFEHTNILTLIGLCPREEILPPWIVFEFMPLGDLASVLRKSSLQFWSSVPTLPALSPESLLSIALQISEGMEYLASQRFVHRDLACRNCLVGSDLVLKIADFGMSRDVYTCDYYKIGGMRKLPVRWMAPESIIFGRFTLESDIWSYGVVLWEIYSYGKQPYYGHSNEEVLKFILDGTLLSIPDDCPHEIADIMKACWKKDIKERLIFTEICNRLSKMKESMSQQNDFSLPRPPPVPVSIDHPALIEIKADDETDDETDNDTDNGIDNETEDDDANDDKKTEDLLDEENYLRPRSRSQSFVFEEYIEPISVV